MIFYLIYFNTLALSSNLNWWPIVPARGPGLVGKNRAGDSFPLALLLLTLTSTDALLLHAFDRSSLSDADVTVGTVMGRIQAREEVEEKSSCIIGQCFVSSYRPSSARQRS